jgi:hypothetical protein
MTTMTLVSYLLQSLLFPNKIVPPKKVIVEEIFKQNEENGDTIMTLKFTVAESNPRSSIDISGLKGVQRQLVDERNDPENETYGWIFTEVREILNFSLSLFSIEAILY